MTTPRRRTAAIALALLPLATPLQGCATSCAGDESYGGPGVVIVYDDVAAHEPGVALHAKACFGAVCNEQDSTTDAGPRVEIPLDDKEHAAEPVTLRVTDSHGSVLVDTQGSYAVPSIHDKSMCGTSIWQLDLKVRGGRLVPAESSTIPPAPRTS